LKTQLVINQTDKSVICTKFGKGRQHDFRIFKNSRVKVIKRVQVLADKGYQGIGRYHTNSCIPHKKPRNGQLTTEQKRQNKEQSRLRVRVENVIRHLKIFRILSSRYRNRRKRFGLRVNLIAGLYNYELKFAASS
jgi:IS5 family transposase